MEYGLVALWWAVLVGLWALGLPIAARLLARVPGRGAGLALPIALVALVLPVFWVGQVSLGPIALGTGLLALVLASVLAYRGGIRESTASESDPPTIDRRAVAECVVVFTLAFSFLVAVRAVDPSLNAANGEKFLDFGLLNALARAPRLPPEDFWFAGRPVSYYYGGHLLAAVLARLTATPAAYAYNLAVAGFYALLVTAVYDLAGAIAAVNGHARTPAGVAGAFFVGVASNLLTPIWLAIGTLPLPAGLQASAASWLASTVENLPAERITTGLAGFSFWPASRVIPDTITEFPLFAWLFGDLHAHMTSTPFLVVAAGLGFAYYCTPEREVGRRRALVFAGVPIVAGFVGLVDLWSLPTVLGVTWLALTFAPARPLTVLPGRIGLLSNRIGRLPDGIGQRPDAPGSDAVSGSVESRPSQFAFGAATTDDREPTLTDRLRAELARATSALAVTVVAGVLALVVAAPFLLELDSQARGIALVDATDRTSLGAFVLVHGAFLAVFAALFVGRLGARSVARRMRANRMLAVLGILWLAVLAWVVPASLFVVPLLLAAWYLLRADRATGFETVLVVGGLGLVLLAEIVHLRDGTGDGRVNTVFKTYAQAWVLWSIAAGVALPRVARGLSGRASATAASSPKAASSSKAASSGRGSSGSWWPSTRRLLGGGLALAVVLSTAVYGGLAVGNHFGGVGNATDDQRYTAPTGETAAVVASGPTLDGTAFVEAVHPDAAPAIGILDNRSGTPTILSAPATGFTPWTTQASALTGIPTVAGWTHATLYHGEAAYLDRVGDVDDAYCGGPERRARVLRSHDVSYIYAGAAERARYANVRAFEDLRGVSPIMETDAVTLYQINRTRLTPTENRRVETCEYNASDLSSVNGSSIEFPRRFHAAGRASDDLIWYGPLMSLPPGTYTATFRVSATGSGSVGTVDVAVGDDHRRVASKPVRATDEPRNVTFSFTLERGQLGVELRGFKPREAGSITLHGVTLVRRYGGDASRNATVVRNSTTTPTTTTPNTITARDTTTTNNATIDRTRPAGRDTRAPWVNGKS